VQVAQRKEPNTKTAKEERLLSHMHHLSICSTAIAAT